MPRIPGRRTFAAACCASALALPAGATTLLFESREITLDAFPISRNVYECDTCTQGDWDDVVLPGPAWEQATPKLLLPDVSAVLPTPPAGVPATLDLVPTIPGDDHRYIARVLDGVLLANDPVFGFLSTARVERDTVFTYGAGQVVHEVTDDEGRRYILFTFDLEASGTWDVSQLDGIGGFLRLPTGWSYSSRVTTRDEVYASGGVATVFSMGGAASFQLVPEPATATLLLAGLCLVGATAPRGGRLRRGPRDPVRSVG